MITLSRFRDGPRAGTAALSTIALSATASYLAVHHAGRLAPAVAATRGYTLAFTVAAALCGLGVVLALVLLPAKTRLEQLREAASGSVSPSGGVPRRPHLDHL